MFAKTAANNFYCLLFQSCIRTSSYRDFQPCFSAVSIT